MRAPATFQINSKRHLTSKYWLRHILIRRALAYNAKSSLVSTQSSHARDAEYKVEL